MAWSKSANFFTARAAAPTIARPSAPTPVVRVWMCCSLRPTASRPLVPKSCAAWPAVLNPATRPVTLALSRTLTDRSATGSPLPDQRMRFNGGMSDKAEAAPKKMSGTTKLLLGLFIGFPLLLFVGCSALLISGSGHGSRAPSDVEARNQCQDWVRDKLKA